jgi:hypothetical protein
MGSGIIYTPSSVFKLLSLNDNNFEMEGVDTYMIMTF